MLSVILSAPTSVGAQNQGKSERDKKDYDLILCPVHVVFVTVVVRDSEGKGVKALRKDDFKIFEGGKEQAIDFWQRREMSTKGESGPRYKIGYYPVDEHLDDNKRKIRVDVTSKGTARNKVGIVANEPDKEDQQ